MTPFWDPNFSPPVWSIGGPISLCPQGARTRGALMPGPQREPGWVRTPGSSYSEGIGSVASSPPLAGPDEGAILEIFELMSVWAETAHFQLPTPRG